MINTCPSCFVRHRSKKEAEKCLEKEHNKRSYAMSHNTKDRNRRESKYINMYVYLKENFV